MKETHTQFVPLSTQFVQNTFFFDDCPLCGPTPLSSSPARSAWSCLSFKSHLTLRCRHAPQAVNCWREVFAIECELPEGDVTVLGLDEGFGKEDPAETQEGLGRGAWWLDPPAEMAKLAKGGK